MELEFNYITPSELLKRHPDCEASLAELRKRANAPDAECCNCDAPVWKFAGLDMCFSCTTGEADASGDYELLPEPNNGDHNG